jgi:hypothetical protein
MTTNFEKFINEGLFKKNNKEELNNKVYLIYQDMLTNFKTENYEINPYKTNSPNYKYSSKYGEIIVSPYDNFIYIDGICHNNIIDKDLVEKIYILLDRKQKFRLT